MKKCKFCGKPAPDNMQGYCQPCYKYFVLEGKKIYPTYDGKPQFAPNGDCICPICGKAFRKLGSHLYNFHGIVANDFFKERGWGRYPACVHKDYHSKMHDIQKDYCVNENLLEKGKDTRFNGARANKKELFHHVIISRCKDCAHCSDFVCNLYNKNCVDIFSCKGER